MRISDWSSDVCSSDLGIAVTRSTNSVDDLIDGVKIDLLAASPGTPVTIGTTRPIASLEQVVTDFVDTYNHMLALLKEDKIGRASCRECVTRVDLCGRRII